MGIRKNWRNLRWKIAKKLLTEEERSLLWGIHKAVVNGFKPVDNLDPLARGSEVYIRAEIDEVCDSLVICRNANGYYYTVPKKDLTFKQFARWENGRCTQCGKKDKKEPRFCSSCGREMEEQKDD